VDGCAGTNDGGGFLVNFRGIFDVKRIVNLLVTSLGKRRFGFSSSFARCGRCS
jgi:hypothetical protein